MKELVFRGFLPLIDPGLDPEPIGASGLEALGQQEQKEERAQEE